MSTYVSLFVRDTAIFHFRNEVFAEFLCLFSPREFCRATGYVNSPDYVRSYTVDPDHFDLDALNELETYAYRTTAKALRDRLDILGLGEDLLRRAVEFVASERLLQAKKSLYHYDEYPEIRDRVLGEIEELSGFDFERWKVQVAQELLRPHAIESNLLDLDPITRFNGVDDRLILRAVVAGLEDDEELVLDLTDLVESGYLGDSDFTPERWRDDLRYVSSVPIVITEGSYDTVVLQAAIRLLAPHLDGYVRFLDYEMGNDGGASALVRTMKSFAAAGISNRIVAVLDNDSAAYDAVRGLDRSKLPVHYAIMHYPDIELAAKYPTLGPQGSVEMDVNGLAASIELYLGRDVLTQLDDTLTPVQWKGYLAGIGRYQGEVLNKAELQKRFRKKVRDAERSDTETCTGEWGDLVSIVELLIATLSALPVDERW